MVVASVGPDGRPIVCRRLACRIDGSGQVRMVLRQPTNIALLQAVERSAGLAATAIREAEEN